jgi:hypothetical protein
MFFKLQGDEVMSKSRNVVAAAIAAAALGLAVGGVYAHPGQAGGGMGPHMKGGQQHRGPVGGHGAAAGHQLLTPEERTELQQKMRAATTPEDRQKLVEATRTEVQKRAAEKGITLPGPGAAAGGRFNHTH